MFPQPKTVGKHITCFIITKKQKQLITLYNKMQQLKRENGELIEFIKFIYEEGHIDDRFNNRCKELFRKHTEEAEEIYKSFHTMKSTKEKNYNVL